MALVGRGGRGRRGRGSFQTDGGVRGVDKYSVGDCGWKYPRHQTHFPLWKLLIWEWSDWGEAKEWRWSGLQHVLVRPLTFEWFVSWTNTVYLSVFSVKQSTGPFGARLDSTVWPAILHWHPLNTHYAKFHIARDCFVILCVVQCSPHSQMNVEGAH